MNHMGVTCYWGVGGGGGIRPNMILFTLLEHPNVSLAFLENVKHILARGI